MKSTAQLCIILLSLWSAGVHASDEEVKALKQQMELMRQQMELMRQQTESMQDKIEQLSANQTSTASAPATNDSESPALVELESGTAVKSTSGEILLAYSHESYDHENPLRGWSAAGNIVTQLPMSKYMGVSLSVRHGRSEEDVGILDASNNETEKTTFEGALFLREPQTGSLYVGYAHQIQNIYETWYSSGLAFRFNVHNTYDIGYVGGEYYLDRFTFGASGLHVAADNDQTYSISDQSYATLSAKWYPWDNASISVLSVWDTRSDHWKGLTATAEYQPEFMKGKGLLRASYTPLVDRRDNYMYDASFRYYLDNNTAFNTRPFISVGISHALSGEGITDGYWRSDSDSITVGAGFAFDNKKSLIERDREYLFNPVDVAPENRRKYVR